MALALILSATAAGAGEAEDGESPGPSAEPLEHCATNLDTGQTACAANPEGARTLVDAAASADAVRLYDARGFGGASYTFYVTGGCTDTYNDIDSQVPDLREPSPIGGVIVPNWNNRASSVRTYNDCDVKLFDGFDYTGAESVWIDEASNLDNIGNGWLNRASSLRIS